MNRERRISDPLLLSEADSSLSERKIFAAIAMHGLLSNPNIVRHLDDVVKADVSLIACGLADDLTKALSDN